MLPKVSPATSFVSLRCDLSGLTVRRGAEASS
jgi:hypothetical protein